MAMTYKAPPTAQGQWVSAYNKRKDLSMKKLRITLALLALAAAFLIPQYFTPDESKYPNAFPLVAIEGENLNAEVPEGLMQKRGPFKKDETICLESQNPATEIKIKSHKDKDGFVYAYDWIVTIKDSSGGNSFTYLMGGNRNYKFHVSEDPETEGCIIFYCNKYDDSGELLPPARAIDKNGRELESHYEIEGHKITQVVSLEKETAFPVTIKQCSF